MDFQNLEALVNPLGLEPRALPTKVGMLYQRPRQKSTSKKNGLPNLEALVNPLGLEPRAHTLKVYCSTN